MKCSFCEKPISKDDKTELVKFGSETHTWHKRCHHRAYESGLIRSSVMDDWNAYKEYYQEEEEPVFVEYYPEEEDQADD